MKTEHIQLLIAALLVAMMIGFMLMQPTNKVLYVSFPLKQPLGKNTGQKVIERVISYGYKIENSQRTTNNCITISKEIVTSICLSTMAIRLETNFKSGDIEDIGGGKLGPTDSQASFRFQEMNKVRDVLVRVFQQNGVQHHPPEYSF